VNRVIFIELQNSGSLCFVEWEFARCDIHDVMQDSSEHKIYLNADF